jgi:predicted metallopeptidase
MTTKVKWIIGIILLIIIGFILFRKSFLDGLKFKMNIGIYQEQTFKQLDIKTTNMVVNRTEDNYLDSVVYVGLNELGMDSIAVTIRPITDEVKQRFDSEGNLKAHILGRGRQYIIFLDDMSRDESIKILSHELIHLRQYFTEKLILHKNGVIWNGRVISEYGVSELKYDDRPWEIEAFGEQRKLENKIRNILY